MTTDPNFKDIIKQEYVKCAKDIVYFIKRYCYIQHPTKGRILFNLYDFQEKVLRDMMNNDYNIILKSRQLGISTLTAGYSLWLMLFNDDINVLALATKQETAKNLVQKVRTMFDMLPSWLKISCIEFNKLSMRLANGSQIKAVSSSPDSARSEAVSLLIIDEAAFISSIEEIWASAQPSLSTGGRCVALSTPNGRGGWFHQQWSTSENGDGRFNTIKLDWRVHPDRDEVWRAEQDVTLGDRLARQECDASFEGTGTSVVADSILDWYEQTYIKDPLQKSSMNDSLWIWQHPDASRKYMVAADCSRGDSDDYSTAQVLDIETLEQVAEFKGKLGTKMFGDFLVGLATQYYDALLLIENASVGWAVIQQVINRGYKNLFHSSADLKYVDINSQFNNKIYSNDKKMVPGVTTSVTTRPLMIIKLETYFRERSIILHSKRTLDELYTFTYQGDKPQAMKGYNDDLVMALAIGLWTRDTSMRLMSQHTQLTKDMIDGFRVSKQQGSAGIYTPNDFGNNPFSMEVHNGTSEDISWLL